MRKLYYATELEKWIMNQYKRLGIYHPRDLNEAYIAQAFRIYYRKTKEAHSIEHGKFRLICVSASKSPLEQKEEFYHELCHLLLHAGRQIMMPKAFRELQEYQANRFTQYAAIPLYMLKNFCLDDHDIIEQLSESFGVTKELVTKRLDRIKANTVSIKKGGL